eukprot:06355.XXX_312883_313272_1 [CDS] Oithona nana genome sequencing.
MRGTDMHSNRRRIVEYFLLANVTDVVNFFSHWRTIFFCVLLDSQVMGKIDMLLDPNPGGKSSLAHGAFVVTAPTPHMSSFLQGTSTPCQHWDKLHIRLVISVIIIVAAVGISRLFLYPHGWRHRSLCRL